MFFLGRRPATVCLREASACTTKPGKNNTSRYCSFVVLNPGVWAMISVSSFENDRIILALMVFICAIACAFRRRHIAFRFGDNAVSRAVLPVLHNC